MTAGRYQFGFALRLILILSIQLVAAALGEAAGDGGRPLDPKMLDYVENIVVSYPDDSSVDIDINKIGKIEYDRIINQRKIDWQNRMNEIRNASGIKPYLFALLDKNYKSIQSEGIPSIMNAIAIREDINEEDIKIISSEILNILGKSYDASDFVANDYMQEGIKVLSRKRSPEHEDIAIQVLNRCDDLNCMQMKAEAAKTLAIIGSSKSLPHLLAASRWVERFGQPGPIHKIFFDAIIQSNTHLIRRLEKEAASLERKHSRGTRFHRDDTIPGSETLNKKSPQSMLRRYWLEILMVGLVVYIGVAIKKYV